MDKLKVSQKEIYRHPKYENFIIVPTRPKLVFTLLAYPKALRVPVKQQEISPKALP